MSEENSQPVDMSAAEVSALDEKADITGAAESRDLDDVTIEYDPSSEVMQDTERDLL